MNIDLLIGFLKDKGRYTPTSEPLHILNVDFQFDAVLLGPDKHDGLVVVHELKGSSIIPIQKKLQAFSIALERTNSMRTVTLILLTSITDSMPSISELTKLCRVLVVSDVTPLDESLATIMPLELPQPISSTDSADVALKKALSEDILEPLIAKLIKAARQSDKEVQEVMRETIDEIAKLPIFI